MVATVMGSIVAAGGIELLLSRPKVLIGDARVIDGDSLVVDGQPVRLWGLDAPELTQPCRDGSPCGAMARAALIDLLGQQAVRCRAEGRDRYRRWLARCERWPAGGGSGQSVNERLVAAGWAVVDPRYASDYLRSSRQAEQAGRGVFAHGGVQLPRLYRADQSTCSLFCKMLKIFAK